MASYTIEDIEIIRNKSGISYQEAVALLDYHNGNVARALIDLERNGRLRADGDKTEETKNNNTNQNGKGGFMNLIQKLYRMRVKVSKEDVNIANLSCLFVGAAFLMSPWTVIVGLVASAVLGYKVSYVKDDPAFPYENLEKTVRNAAQNAKNTVDDIARNVQDALNSKETKADAATKTAAADIREGVEDLAQDAAAETRSFYASNPAATTYKTTYGGTAPTIQVPVKVESTDGDVSFNSEADGHNSATIG